MTETTLTGAAHHGAAPRPLKCITVRQPWASCIASGQKRVENRSRPTSYRGLLAIHAGVSHDRAADLDSRVTALYGPDPRVGMPTGAVLAVAELVDCHLGEPDDTSVTGVCCPPWGEPQYSAAVAHHLVLADVRALDEPVRAKGALGLWTLPADVEAAVRVQIEVAS